MEGLSTELEPGRWLVHTLCHECFIDVETSENHSDTRWISVGLLSTHDGEWRGRLRTRLRYAWEVLRGNGVPFLDLNTRQEIDALTATLQEARARAFLDE